MNRPAARVRVNAEIDCLMQNAPRLTPDQIFAMQAGAPVIVTIAGSRVIKPGMFFNGATAAGYATIIIPDHFGDEGLTLAQKRRREEMLHVN